MNWWSLMRTHLCINDNEYSIVEGFCCKQKLHCNSHILLFSVYWDVFVQLHELFCWVFA